MGSRELKSDRALSESTVEVLEFAMSDLNLSAGPQNRILKVPRHRRFSWLREHFGRPRLGSYSVLVTGPPTVDVTA
jgi:hypothetical protein